MYILPNTNEHPLPPNSLEGLYMHLSHMAPFHHKSSSNGSLVEGSMIGSGTCGEYCHTSMDDKFIQLQDDLRFRRNVTVNDSTTQFGYSGESFWQEELMEPNGTVKPTKRQESFWEPERAVESSLRSTSMESRKSSFALYNYFSRRSAEEFPITGGPLQGQYPTFYEGYYGGSSNDMVPMPSYDVPVVHDLCHVIEADRRTNALQVEPKLPIPKKLGTVFLKILATQLVSGTIIGRGGKGLNWFRRKSKVEDITLSMPWELYPKTDYRTLFLKGTTKAVVKATCIIADLMLSKYTAQHSETVTERDRMLVLVVLPLFFRSAMERIKDICNPSLISITLFHSSSAHQEIVAVLKGVKSQVKELVATIANSIAKTLDPKDYCHVAYPGPDGINPKFIPKGKLIPGINAVESTPEEEKRVEKVVGKNTDDKTEEDDEEHADCVTPDQTTQEAAAEIDTDADTEELQSADSNENGKGLEGMFGVELSAVDKSLNLTTAVAIAEAKASIKNHQVNLNIIIEESKIPDAMTCTRRSSCYVTTAPSDNPGTVVVSLSGSFAEAVAVASLILSVI